LDGLSLRVQVFGEVDTSKNLLVKDNLALIQLLLFFSQMHLAVLWISIQIIYELL